MVHQFSIEFSLVEIKKDIISYPFRIVFQTKSREIEEYCFL